MDSRQSRVEAHEADQAALFGWQSLRNGQIERCQTTDAPEACCFSVRAVNELVELFEAVLASWYEL